MLGKTQACPFPGSVLSPQASLQLVAPSRLSAAKSRGGQGEGPPIIPRLEAQDGLSSQQERLGKGAARKMSPTHFQAHACTHYTMHTQMHTHNICRTHTHTHKYIHTLAPHAAHACPHHAHPAYLFTTIGIHVNMHIYQHIHIRMCMHTPQSTHKPTHTPHRHSCSPIHT